MRHGNQSVHRVGWGSGAGGPKRGIRSCVVVVAYSGMKEVKECIKNHKLPEPAGLADKLVNLYKRSHS